MKRIKKSTSKTVSIRVPEVFFNKWKAASEAEGISMSDVIWSELTEKKGITNEQERFLVKAYLTSNRIMDLVLDAEDSKDKRIVEMVKLWQVVNDEFEGLIFSLFGDDIYSPKYKLPEQDKVHGELSASIKSIDDLYDSK